MKKTWKVAVIGCGMFANRQYFPYIRKETNAEIVAAVDIVVERAIKACEEFHIPAYYSSVEELLEKCDFDIAIDAASIQAHHEINMTILSAGKHLISQKPAAPNVEMLTEQIELAKKMNVKFTCVPVHPMRYDINTAKQWIADGVIGNVYYLKSIFTHGGPEYFQYRDVDPTWFFEAGAGGLVDMGVHALQVATTIFGPAKRVACMGKVCIPNRIVRSGAYDGKEIIANQIPDQYMITLDFGGNKMAFIDTGFCERDKKTPYMEIFGDKGTISFTEFYLKNEVPELYVDDIEKGIRGWMKPMKSAKPYEKIESQCCCLRDIIRAIENDTEPVLKPEHARHVLEIMCKIPKAMEEGITVDLETTF